MTDKQPETRTRVLFGNTQKNGWEVKEITIELTNVPFPDQETGELFDELLAAGKQHVAAANAANPWQ